MTFKNSGGARAAAGLTVIALIASACSGSTTTASPAPDPAENAPASADPVADQPQETPADTPAEPVTESEQVNPIDPPADESPDPVDPLLKLSPGQTTTDDPNETLEQLESVIIRPAEGGGAAVTFAAMNNDGLRVKIDDTDKGASIFCDMYIGSSGPMSACSGTLTATGEFMPTEPLAILDDPAGPYTFVVPMTADDNYVSITLNGVVYMAPFVTFADEPGLVQLNPDGTLTNPVTRTTGTATAAQIAEKLNA